jgi:S1-C subfamily serine protease
VDQHEQQQSARGIRRSRLGIAGLIVGALVGAGAATLLVRSHSSATRAATVTVQSGSGGSAVSIAAPTVVPQAGSYAAIYRAAAPAVVDITATSNGGGNTNPFGQSQSSVAEGTGFVIDSSGHILTNEHVVSGASSINVAFADGFQTTAKLVGTDPSSDLAMLQVNVASGELHPVALGDSATVVPGDAVVAIGNPFGLTRSISAGIISGIDREMTAPNGFTITGAIQTDAAINHGNSGGPLLDMNGRVIGITAQIANSGVDANVGVGFAVPINDATRELQALEKGSVQHAWLGISGQSLTSSLASAAHLSTTHGVLITGVTPQSPASRAGLSGGNSAATVGGGQVCVGGDAIISVDGQPLSDMAQLQQLIGGKRPGDAIRVGVARPDTSGTNTVTVTLASQPTSAPQVTGCG